MKHATQHWWMQRVTSVPLIPLFFYFITQIKYLTVSSRADFISWMQQPLVSSALIVFIICSFYHGSLGIDEIIEDYVSAEKCKTQAMRLNKIIFFALGAVCLYAIMRIYNGRF